MSRVVRSLAIVVTLALGGVLVAFAVIVCPRSVADGREESVELTAEKSL
jgi:hypothetical protein